MRGRFGLILFGLSTAGLASVALRYGDFRGIVEPPVNLASWLKLLPSAVGAIVFLAGAGLLFAPTAGICARTILGFAGVWAMVRARLLFLSPLSVGSCYGVFEALGPFAGIWMYCAATRRGAEPRQPPLPSMRQFTVARVIFGAACLEYGAAHFAFAAYTAAMVPAWLPWHMPVVYLTGAGHLAAGLAMVFGVLPRLAAAAEATMVTLLGIMVWIPSFFERPIPRWALPRQVQWSETCLTFLLAGAAWLVSSALGEGDRGSAPR